jgi:hypothetical protein
MKARGRLIAVDGGGPALTAAARSLLGDLKRERDGSGVSGWDSSGIFTELETDSESTGPSARTLTLLYAADLAFRIRWHIRPALEAGHSVVAAPYVETAKALAIAAGIPRRWLQELFRFAPRPDSTYHVGERRSPVRGRARPDYVDCFLTAMVAGGHGDPAQLKKQSLAYLSALEKQGRARRYRGES